MNKFKVGVLMGGMSIEKEVSFNSGRTICDHLSQKYYEVLPIFQTQENEFYLLPTKFLYRGKISDFKNRLKNEAQRIILDDLKNIIDFVFIAQYGRYSEDGSIQGMLEILNIPYFGSKVLASAIGMNKILQKQLLKFHKISVANGINLNPIEIEHFIKNKNELLDILKKNNLIFPLVIKPNCEGSSLGVSIAKNENELFQSILIASSIDEKNRQSVLIEEKIEGMEFSCITLTNPKTLEFFSLPITEIVYEKGTDFHDYTQKYMPGRSTKYTPARCSQELTLNIQETCKKVSEIIGFTNMSRIDGFLQKDETVVIIDPNSFTGAAPSSFLFNQAAAIDMSHSDLINHLIETELYYYKLENRVFNLSDVEILIEKKMNIAVIFGGTSNEKETSLESGRNVCYKLDSTKYNVIPLFLNKDLNLYKISSKILVCNSTSEIENNLNLSTKILWNDLKIIADFVFIALHGGLGENGSIQGMLELLEIPYNGSGVTSSALCMDKYKTSLILQENGILNPNGCLLSKKDWHKDQMKSLSKILLQRDFPLIAKPCDDGCSVMVFKSNNENELIENINKIFENKDKMHVLIEPFIKGIELTIGVIGNNNPVALTPSQSISSGDILTMEEKFLPGAGENQTPALIGENAIQLAKTTVVAAYKALLCSGYARIDCFYQNSNQSKTGKDEIIILECNTLPALTPATCLFHQAAEDNIKPFELLDKIIEYGIEKHKKLNI